MRLRLDVGRNRLLFAADGGEHGVLQSQQPLIDVFDAGLEPAQPLVLSTTPAVDGVDIVTRFASRSAFIFSIVSDGDASPVVAVSRALLLWSASGGGPSDEVIGSRRRRWIGPPVRRPELEVAVPLIARALRFLPLCVWLAVWTRG